MNFQKHWAATLDDYAIDLAWSPDGKLLAAASGAGAVSIYDAAGILLHKLPGHDHGTNCLAWMPETVGGALCPDGSRDKPAPTILATGGQDGKVKLWNATTGALHAEAALGDDWVEHLAWVSAGDALCWPAESPRSDRGEGAPTPKSLLFAAAGKKLVALRADGSVAHTFKGAPKTITALAVGRTVLGEPRLGGDAAPPPRSDRAEGGAAPVQPLLASAYFGGVCVWNAATFAAEKEFFYGNTIHALVWSPDGRWLVAGCQDNAVHLWAPAEDLELHMSGYETKLKELSFSRDSKWLATGGGRDACVWDCTGAGPEGREPLLLPHNARTIAVAFQNQHGLVATGAADGEFCLWSPTRKNPLIAEVKMPAAATKFAWSPDDTLLAVGTEKGSVFVFRVSD